KEPVILFWSGGKDSYLALEKLKASSKYTPFCLLSVIDKKTNQIKYHGVKESLLVKQAEFLKLPLQRVYLAPDSSNKEYLMALKKYLDVYLKKKIQTIAFGDIFLEEIKKFKDETFHSLGFKTIYPLWGKTSQEV